ncbi:MAG: dihydroorotate dehydrogenase-like protein [Chloroflexi bacterium]|nr:dihydroorotate dehydrogenase-like protein [Chloroflexota bacterium]MBP8056308.1 dihydroorotate dehydrogenase-like protein [Chloroflexota bacterium]
MPDLATTYLGFPLQNPLVVSASPLTASIAQIRQLEAAGAAAIVLPSLFTEQVKLQSLGMEYYLAGQRDVLPEALKHIPDMEGYNKGVGGYLAYVHQAKTTVRIPIIASLNGDFDSDWLASAKMIQAAGADALELNLYFLSPQPSITAGEIEDRMVRLVQTLHQQLRIPIAVKLSPYFTAFANLAQRLDQAGANALVLFNRFYQPDFDIEQETVTPTLDLSNSQELRLRLRWTSILHHTIRGDLAITGGIHSTADVIKGLMAGAKVVMLTSALFMHGFGHITQLVKELDGWLQQHHIASVTQIRGRMSQQYHSDPAAFERANYMTVLKSFHETTSE